MESCPPKCIESAPELSHYGIHPARYTGKDRTGCIAEAIQDLGVQDKTILVSPVGCTVFAYYYFDLGNVQAAHGRASATATAVKPAYPDKFPHCSRNELNNGLVIMKNVLNGKAYRRVCDQTTPDAHR